MAILCRRAWSPAHICHRFWLTGQTSLPYVTKWSSLWVEEYRLSLLSKQTKYNRHTCSYLTSTYHLNLFTRWSGIPMEERERSFKCWNLVYLYTSYLTRIFSASLPCAGRFQDDGACSASCTAMTIRAAFFLSVLSPSNDETKTIVSSFGSFCCVASYFTFNHMWDISSYPNILWKRDLAIISKCAEQYAPIFTSACRPIYFQMPKISFYKKRYFYWINDLLQPVESSAIPNVGADTRILFMVVYDYEMSRIETVMKRLEAFVVSVSYVYYLK